MVNLKYLIYYHCQYANSHVNVAKSSFSYVCAVAPVVTIDPPQSPLTKCVNDSLRLFCTAKGLPVPKILWYEGNTPIIQPFPHSFLVPTKSPHTTNYTCVATNNAGGKTHQASVSVIVIIKGIQHNYVLYILAALAIMCMSKNN